MATRLIGTDDANPRLPAVVVTATQGTTAADLAPGDIGTTTTTAANAYTDAQLAAARAYTDVEAADAVVDANNYTDAQLAAAVLDPADVAFADNAQTIAGTATNLAVSPAGLSAYTAARAMQTSRVNAALIRFELPTPPVIAVMLNGTTYSLYRSIGSGLYCKSDLALFSTDPGNYPLHQMFEQTVVMPMSSVVHDVGAAVTKTGTWTVSAGGTPLPFGGDAAYATVAGAYIEWVSPATTRGLGYRRPMWTNGGLYAKVTIDGDATTANLLPTAQAEVTAGRLASSALVANGGTLNPTDRITHSYVSSTGAQNGDVIQGVAAGLTAKAYTVRFTATAYSVAALASQRFYFTAFSAGDGSTTLAAADAVMPMDKILAARSAWEHANYYLPTGATTVEWLGNVHGYEIEDALTVYVDGRPTTLTAGTYTTATEEILIVRDGHFVHPQTGATSIALTHVTYRVNRAGLELFDRITWQVGGTLHRAYAMCPLEGVGSNVAGAVKFNRAALAAAAGTVTLTGADTFTAGSKSSAVWLWANPGNYGVLYRVLDGETYTNGWAAPSAPYTRLEDRNNAGGRITKVYHPVVGGDGGTLAVAPGNVHQYRAVITPRYFPGAGAELAMAEL